MNSLHKKLLAGLAIGLLLLPLAFVALPAYPVHAQTNTDGPEEKGASTQNQFVAAMQSIVLTIIDAVRGWLSSLLAGVTEAVRWMLDYGTTVMTFPVVKAGFEVTLSLVNLLLVMTLIILSFQFILDLHASEAKKTLGKIILAALLINFSLLIAGVLLDLSNVFTNYFLADITPLRLGNALQPQRFLAFTQGFGTGFWGNVVAALFSLTMTAIILITMIAVLVMATVRNIATAGLLLVMPLTWGLWVFPGMKQYHSDWWQNFMKYGVTYLPTVTFFIWLALSTAGNVEFLTQTDTINKGIGSSLLGGALSSVIQLILIIGIMIFGLKAAEKAGDGAHAIAMGVARRSGIALRAAGMTAVRADIGGYGVAAGGRKIARGGSQVLGNKYLRWIPGMQQGSNILAGMGSRSEDIGAIQKAKFSNLTENQLVARLRSSIPVDKSEAAALLKTAVEKHKVDEIPHANLAGYIEAAKLQNRGTVTRDIKEVAALVAHDPTLARLTTDETFIDNENSRRAAHRPPIAPMTGPEIATAVNTEIGRAIRKATTKEAGQWERAVFHIDPAHPDASLDDAGIMQISNAQWVEIGRGKPEVRAAALARMEHIRATFLAGGYAVGSDEHNAGERIDGFLTRNPGLQIASTYGGGTP